MSKAIFSLFAALIMLGAVLFFLYIFPGPYKYEYQQSKWGVVRIDRTSGDVSIWRGGHYNKLINMDNSSLETAD